MKTTTLSFWLTLIFSEERCIMFVSLCSFFVLVCVSQDTSTFLENPRGLTDDLLMKLIFHFRVTFIPRLKGANEQLDFQLFQIVFVSLQLQLSPDSFSLSIFHLLLLHYCLHSSSTTQHHHRLLNIMMAPLTLLQLHLYHPHRNWIYPHEQKWNHWVPNMLQSCRPKKTWQEQHLLWFAFRILTISIWVKWLPAKYPDHLLSLKWLVSRSRTRKGKREKRDTQTNFL